MAGRSRRAAVLVARRRLRRLLARRHADHRPRVLLRGACPRRIRRWPGSTAEAPGHRTATTRTRARTAPTTSPAPTCCASTATIGKTQVADRIHQRLRSWSMNTIANWSDAAIYRCDGSEDALRRFGRQRRRQADRRQQRLLGQVPRSLRPVLPRSARSSGCAGRRTRSAGDPWCIGYFVDNELAWGDELSLATAALASPPEQAAKQAFLADLKQKYNTIEKLNDAWGTDHASWDALAECRTPPDTKKAARRSGCLLHADRRGVFPGLPRGGQAGGSGQPVPGLPLRLGQRSGRSERPPSTAT